MDKYTSDPEAPTGGIADGTSGSAEGNEEDPEQQQGLGQFACLFFLATEISLNLLLCYINSRPVSEQNRQRLPSGHEPILAEAVRHAIRLERKRNMRVEAALAHTTESTPLAP